MAYIFQYFFFLLVKKTHLAALNPRKGGSPHRKDNRKGAWHYSTCTRHPPITGLLSFNLYLVKSLSINTGDITLRNKCIGIDVVYGTENIDCILTL